MSAELITAIALIIGAIIQGWKTRAEVKKMAAETRGILADPVGEHTYKIMFKANIV